MKISHMYRLYIITEDEEMNDVVVVPYNVTSGTSCRLDWTIIRYNDLYQSREKSAEGVE